MFALDFLFFTIVNIVLLNVVFGIIIDTFGDLRAEKNEIRTDMLNVCFICNIERSMFERNDMEFRHHIKSEHYMWDYLKFLTHVWCKDPNNYNGERCLERCLASPVPQSPSLSPRPAPARPSPPRRIVVHCPWPPHGAAQG